MSLAPLFFFYFSFVFSVFKSFIFIGKRKEHIIIPVDTNIIVNKILGPFQSLID